MGWKECVRIGLAVCLFAGMATGLGCGGGSEPPDIPDPPTPTAPAAGTGTLATTQGASITDEKLADQIDLWIPAEVQRLIVFTQCYGGDCVDNFDGKANTAVASATQPGQLARYGGYDNDAADALKPGAGRTGKTVHDAGVAGKAASETPTTGGGLALDDFSLEDVTSDGDVRSRHVVVYAGQPDSAAGRDNDQRDAIKANFAGKTNTTVSTVGGDGTGGWDEPGSSVGLARALAVVRRDILASPDPSKEQFILFVTDHGDKHKKKTPATTTVPGCFTMVCDPVLLDPAFECWSGADTAIIGQMQNDPGNEPGFSIFLDAQANGIQIPDDGTTVFLPGELVLNMNHPVHGTIPLENFGESVLELSGDLPGMGTVGDLPGEGVRVHFPLAEDLFIANFFDVIVEVDIVNTRDFPIAIEELSQDTGTMMKELP